MLMMTMDCGGFVSPAVIYNKLAACISIQQMPTPRSEILQTYEASKRHIVSICLRGEGWIGERGERGERSERYGREGKEKTRTLCVLWWRWCETWFFEPKSKGVTSERASYVRWGKFSGPSIIIVVHIQNDTAIAVLKYQGVCNWAIY